MAPAGLDDLMYSAQSSASNLASSAMAPLLSAGSTSLSMGSLAILYAAGLLTSFSPCSLGMLPVTISYISSAAGERDDNATFLPTVAFASGLASTFVALGLSASLVGGVFSGGWSSYSPDVVADSGEAAGIGLGAIMGNTAILAALSSCVAIAMGLQILNLVKIPLPSVQFDLPFESSSNTADSSASATLLFDDNGNILPTSLEQQTQQKQQNPLSALLRVFLLGGSLALVESPCATPVLASILAYVALCRDITAGGILLLCYTIGYVTPLLVVGSVGGQALVTLQSQSSDDEGEDSKMSVVGAIGKAVTPLTASILIWYGTTGFLTAMFGDPSVMGLAPVLE